MHNHYFRVTNADGRAPNLLTQEQFIPGKYMIRFETEAYFKEIGVSSFFYPYVEVGKCNLLWSEYIQNKNDIGSSRQKVISQDQWSLHTH